jgi:precorrin-2 methylase
MIHDVPKPEISANFTIDDIHKIREWHYEMLKDATPEERMDFYNNKAERVEAEIRAARKAKAV